MTVHVRPIDNRSTAATRWVTDVRAEGGGHLRIEQSQPGVMAALEKLVDPLTRGDPTSPLRTFETIVGLIGNTRTAARLRVKAKLDKGKYPLGVVTTNAEMDALSLHRNDFRGEWNHEIRPRQVD